MTQPQTTPVPRRANSVTPRPKAEVEVGISAYLPFVTPYKDAWEALRDDDITVKQLIAMRRTDGQARALYRLITLPIRSALKGATFVPAGNVDGGDEEAQFIEQMFTLPSCGGGMVVPFHRVIAQMLMAVFDGFAAFEMVFWSPPKGPFKGKWTLKKMAYRPAESLSFLLDDNGEYAGLRQRIQWQGRFIDVRIPADASVYWAANEEERPFYGRSYFETAFWHWDKKFKLYVIAHIAAQRAAVGTRVGKLPKNPAREEKTEFTKALGDLGVAQYITVPEDYSVESLKESGGFDFLAYINHHNSQMSKSILAAFFDDQQGSGGDASLVDFGRQSDALFLLMLQTIMSEIEEVVNTKIIPRFIDWNFGSGKYPTFQFGSLSEEQKTALLDMFKVLAVAGQALTISQEFVQELEKQVAEQFGLEIDWEAVDARRAAEEAMQAAMPDPAAAGAPGAPGAAAPAVPLAPVKVPATVVPPGFQLSVLDDATVLELAGELDHDEWLALTRGVPRTGGPKYIRTPAGARVYGAPVGTPITRDLAERAGAHGVKGKNFGVGIQDPGGPKTAHQVLGGGPGAPAQDPGGVAIKPDLESTPRRAFTNPKAPGAVLLEFRDGTVAIRDSAGNMSARQPMDIHQFIQLGWQVTATAPPAAPTGGKPGVSAPASKAPGAAGKTAPAPAPPGGR